MRHLGLPLLLSALLAPQVHAAGTVYLNQANITVSQGAGTSPGDFNNTFNGGRTLDKVIDAPSADAAEIHSQTTHIWFTADVVGGGLELVFDFGTSYDLRTLHFWNYDSEGFDVDTLRFQFFNAAGADLGSLSLTPALGSSPAIYAQDIPLAAPLNVRNVTVFLAGSNRQVDFQNIGFTAEVSAIPEPASTALFLLGLGGLAAWARRRH